MGTSKVPPAQKTITNTNCYYKPAPAEVVHKNLRFLITDRPSDVTIYQFIDELRKHNCKDVVRVCEPTYKIEPLETEGVVVFDWEFPDGHPPPKDVKEKWIRLVKERTMLNPGSCIAVHCVAGLGRAPVLVAIALMEAGMKYEDAVELIRQHRRGAINQKQLAYLGKYKSAGELKKRDKECCIM